MLDFSWLAPITDWFAQLFSLNLEELLDVYGYYAILLLTFLEGETVVIVAGVLASQGLMTPWLIALCAFCGSFTSDQIMFSLGKYKGVDILRRFPRLDKKVTKAAKLLVKYDTALILGFRFVYGVRNVTPILLGISKVNHAKFFILNFIGAAVWAVSFTAAGYFSGMAFTTIMAENKTVAVLYILGIVLIIAAAVFFFRRRKKRASETQAGEYSENVRKTTETDSTTQTRR